MEHQGGGFDFLGGVIHAISVSIMLGGALAIGIIIDISKHPMEWLEDFWFPLLLIVAGIIRSFWEE